MQKSNFLQAINGKKHFALGILILIPLVFALPAYAHHPWEGEVASFHFFQSLASGILHPVLGFDHLLFLLSIGLVGGISPIKGVPSLVAIGLTGSLSSQFLPLIPGSEVVAALSLIASAFVFLRKLPRGLIVPLIFCHGYVLGNAMLGAEPTPLIGYLMGLLVSETLIVLGGLLLVERFCDQRKILCGILMGAGLILASNNFF